MVRFWPHCVNHSRLRRWPVCFSLRSDCRCTCISHDRVGESSMKNRSLTVLLVIALVAITARAQARRFAGPESTHAASLQELVDDAARTALTKFAEQKLTQEQLSI